MYDSNLHKAIYKIHGFDLSSASTMSTLAKCIVSLIPLSPAFTLSLFCVWARRGFLLECLSDLIFHVLCNSSVSVHQNVINMEERQVIFLAICEDTKSGDAKIIALWSKLAVFTIEFVTNFRTLKQAIDDFSTNANRFSLADAGDAIFSEKHWPLGFRCNGHSMLNCQKVSKLIRNFRTLKQAIDDFSTNATRFSLADAGDGMNDANLCLKPLMLRFCIELKKGHEWKRDNYGDYMFREALKSRFYDLQAVRDEYRVFCGLSGMNRDLLLWTCLVA
nr:leucine--tRNA ligase, cytoplasmic-like [Tanacetum cinerariifolium]